MIGYPSENRPPCRGRAVHLRPELRLLATGVFVLNLPLFSGHKALAALTFCCRCEGVFGGRRPCKLSRSGFSPKSSFPGERVFSRKNLSVLSPYAVPCTKQNDRRAAKAYTPKKNVRLRKKYIETKLPQINTAYIAFNTDKQKQIIHFLKI